MSPTHLIICCCHSIYHPPPSQIPPNPPGTSPTDWLLAPFQEDEHTIFFLHAQTSISLLASDPDALLVFSGGFTDAGVRVSEGASYLRLCEDCDFWEGDEREEGDGGKKEGRKKGLRERIMVEEKALDSLQNLLFSILAFWRRVGEWPGRISIVSMGFKERRFMELHIPSLNLNLPLNLPPQNIKFIGLNPSYMTPSPTLNAQRTKAVLDGERTRGYSLWKRDMLGNGSLLRGKRVARDFWGMRGVWFVSDEERGRAGVRSEIGVFGGVEEEVFCGGVWGLGERGGG